MKKIKKLLSAIVFAFALLLIMPVILPGYSNTATVQAAPKKITLFKGYEYDTRTISFSSTNLTWVSSNTSVATVTATNNGSKIKITPKSSGTAYIKFKRANSSKYTIQYQVNVIAANKVSIVRSKNGSYTLKLNGVPSGTSVKWSVTDASGNATSVAKLSSATSTSVKVTGNAKGTAYVRVSINGAVKKCTRIKVEAPSLSKTAIGLTKGNTYTLKVNNTTQKVTWSSSNTSIATVTSTGKVTAKAVGSAKIYASVAGVKYPCKITVSEVPTPATYYKTLTNKISKNNKIGSSGNHYISRTTKSGNTKFGYSIVYEKSKDRLKFVFNRKDTNTKRYAAITMYVYNPEKSTKSAPNIAVTTKKGVYFRCKTSFDNKTYSGTVDIPFSITKSNITITASSKADMQTVANYYLEKAFKGWDTLLKKNNSSFEKLGFTAYS